MNLTRIDLNSWLVQMAGHTILLDPWLTRDLTFYGQPWLFRARQANPIFTPQTLPTIDILLLSQGLDDHCHRPTLAQLDHALPVVASAAAAKVVSDLGYQNIHLLKPGASYHLGDLEIQAMSGAQVGMDLENGYLLRDHSSGLSLYYEPHGASSANSAYVPSQADILLVPVVGQIFPLLGQVIMGKTEVLGLVQQLQPRFVIPTTQAEVTIEGILPNLTQTIGSLEEFRHALARDYPEVKFLTPAPGETLILEPA